MSENGTIHPQLERLEKTALKVGAAGLALCAVGALLNRLPGRLARGGTALLEIGDGQDRAVSAMAAALPGRWSVDVKPDLAGRPRIVRITSQS